MQTGGASLGSEAPCLMTFDGEVFDFPLGRTVWFALQGTGGPITVDTGGSNFDTVVAAYVGAGLDQVACVDDAPIQRTPQGRVTIDTQLGVTYLVQVGGVVGNFGSEDPEYGRLRLNVYSRGGMRSPRASPPVSNTSLRPPEPGFGRALRRLRPRSIGGSSGWRSRAVCRRARSFERASRTTSPTRQ